jgi:glucokinase
MSTEDEELTAIGAGSCGVIRDGSILYSPNTQWKSLALAEALKARFQVPAVVINDADTFALGVYHFEFREQFSGLCALTLGSGLGGSLISERGLVRSMSGISPEIGHIKVREGGARCSCGGTGCLEAYVSKRALMASYRRYGGSADMFSPYDVYQAFRRGDDAAEKAFATFGRYLGTGMSTIYNLFAPPAFVLGGGISRAARAFLPTARQALSKGIMKGIGPRPRIVVSKMRSRASLLGAACQARSSFGTVLK